MQVFLYEYLTGGGMWQQSGKPPGGSLLAEGRAMIQAVAADFAALPKMEVVTIRDSRLAALHPATCRVTIVVSEDEEREALRRLANSADWTLLIAPETGGALLERCRAVEDAGGRILSAPSALIEIVANKQTTVDLLSRCRVPVPRGVLLTPGERELPRNIEFPIVVKPVDGCGSQGVRLFTAKRNQEPFSGVGDSDRDSASKNDSRTALLRVEEFIPG
ncbi:MAG TPA: ATP-grasp domain-containing protein, partial [Pirellulaceae bacterium]|nr:ATP-grasp domain-containing protein [Pirellulaceae bacterium]